MTLQGLNDAKHWRDRAAEMRVLSAEMKDAEAQTIVARLANDYDKLADRAELRAARDMPRPKANGASTRPSQQLRQLGDIGRNPSRFIASSQSHSAGAHRKVA
jgi:hypothetical protein